MGFDAWFFARLDIQDSDNRKDTKTMEWVWQPSPDYMGKDLNIFTHALYAHYSAPEGFNMYMTGSEDPWISDPTNTDFNGDKYAAKLIDVVEQRKEAYATDDIFIVFGDDFKFINAHWMYLSMDNMIDYMNENHGDKYHFRYSTPSNYVDALKVKDHVWPTKTDDMFPYSSGAHDYWTGYFTSRANAKSYFRRISSEMSSSNTLYAQKMLDQDKAQKDTQIKAMKANYGVL